MENLSLLTSMAIVLGIALVAGMFVRRLGLPVILGYLMGGVVIGPYGLALVKDEQNVETLATIGVVLLMFALGIEFSLKALRRVGRVAIIGGIAQILATIALGVLVGWLLGWEIREAILFGLFISLSSTIIVLRTLMERGDLGSTHGRVMIGILLVQDLSVVPMMVIIPSIEESGTALLGALAWAALKAMAFLGGIIVLGLWVLPWLMRKVAEVRSRELFLLTIVCLGLGAAFAANEMGLSIALGAFVAGLLVSESDYAHQALADIRPLRDVFAVLFFVSLGMLIDPGFVADNPAQVSAVVAAIVLGKFLITALVARAFGYSDKTVLFVGSGLFQIGEFSFVLAALALDIGILSNHLYSLTLTAAVITILLTPFAMNLASAFYHRLAASERGAHFLAARADPGPPDDYRSLANHVVICGYGQVSANLGRILERRKFSYVVIDIDPRVIDSARERGIPSIYGDASNPEVLAQAELGKCRVLVVTFPDPIATKLTVEHARRINPRLDVVARIHTDEEFESLKHLGVAELVRPELEAGLEIIRHTLHRFGLSSQEILYVVNTLRDDAV